MYKWEGKERISSESSTFLNKFKPLKAGGKGVGSPGTVSEQLRDALSLVDALRAQNSRLLVRNEELVQVAEEAAQVERQALVTAEKRADELQQNLATISAQSVKEIGRLRAAVFDFHERSASAESAHASSDALVADLLSEVARAKQALAATTVEVQELRAQADEHKRAVAQSAEAMRTIALLSSDLRACKAERDAAMHAGRPKISVTELTRFGSLSEKSSQLNIPAIARRVSMNKRLPVTTGPVAELKSKQSFRAHVPERGDSFIKEHEIQSIQTITASGFSDSICTIVIENVNIQEIMWKVSQNILFPSHLIGHVCTIMLNYGLLVEMHTLARTAVTGMGKAANQKELVEIIFWISNLHQFLCILESLKLRESAKPNNLGPLNAITSSQEAVYDILEDELLPVLFDNLGRDIASLASSAVLNGIDLHLYRNENNRNTFTNMFLMGGRVVANTAQQQLASSDGLMRLNICLTTVNRVLKDCLVPPELRERMLLQMLKGVGEGGTKALLEMRGGLSPAVARHVLVNVDVIVGWYGGIGMGSAKRHVANIKEVCAITLMRKRLPEDADSVISAGKLLGAAQVSTLLETCFDTRGEEELGMTEEFIEVLKNRVSKATQANRVCEEGDEGDMSMFVAPIDHCDTTVPPMITLPAGIKSLFVK